MPQSKTCRLCIQICNNYRNLYDANGRKTRVDKIIVRYFDDLLSARGDYYTAVCLKCWSHLMDFHNFRKYVLLAQSKLIDVEVSRKMDEEEYSIAPHSEFCTETSTCEMCSDDDATYNTGLSDATEQLDLPEEYDDPVGVFVGGEFGQTCAPLENESNEPENRDEDILPPLPCSIVAHESNEPENRDEDILPRQISCSVLEHESTEPENGDKEILSRQCFSVLGHEPLTPGEQHQSDATEQLDLTEEYDDPVGVLTGSILENENNQPENRNEDILPRQPRSMLEHESNEPEDRNEYILPPQTCSTVAHDSNEPENRYVDILPRPPCSVLEHESNEPEYRDEEILSRQCFSVLKHEPLTLRAKRKSARKEVLSDAPVSNNDNFESKLSSQPIEKSIKRNQNQQSNFECEVCRKSCDSFPLLQNHFLQEHPNDDCYILCCQRRFYQQSRYEIHVHSHTETAKIHRCPQCPKAYSYKAGLVEHVRLKHTGGALKCLDLKRHIATTHMEPDAVHRCPHCPETYVRKKKLYQHVRLKHTVGRFKCNICSKIYSCSTRLNEHFASHSGIRIYKCAHCPKTYRYRSSLCHHIGHVHPGKRRVGRVTKSMLINNLTE